MALLERVCEIAREQVTPAPSGRPADDDLYVWVAAVSDFWVNTLKRAYTLDTHQQEHVTEAGRFLADCMGHLDSGAVPRIASQMRRYMQEKHPPRKNLPKI